MDFLNSKLLIAIKVLTVKDLHCYRVPFDSPSHDASAHASINGAERGD